MSECFGTKEEIIEDKFVTLIKLRNPFNLKELDREQVAWEPNKTFGEYLPTVIGKHGEVELVASLNGKVVFKEQWDTTYLLADDNIIMCPVIGKGSGSKSIFRLIALIAIAVVAPYAAGAIGSIGGVALGTAGALTLAGTAVAAGISMVGGMLVNSLLSSKPSTNDANRGGDNLGASPSYGYDGPKNMSAEGVPVPVVYGTYRTGGNLIDAYVENIGNSQYIYMLFAVSEGEIAGVGSITINDQPVENFRDVAIEIRTGLPTQGMIGWFGDTIVPHTVGLKLTPSFSTFNTTGVVDKLRFDVSLPGGLFSINTKSGNIESRSVELLLQYRKVGDVTWQSASDQNIIDHYDYYYQVDGVNYATLPFGCVLTPTLKGSMAGVSALSFSFLSNSLWWAPHAIYRAKQSTGVFSTLGSLGTLGITGTSSPDYVVVGTTVRVPVYRAATVISDATRTAIRRSYTTGILPQGQYETRFARTTVESMDTNVSDQVYINDINEIIVDDVQYNNTALVGARILLSDQLNGLPKITFLVHGVKVRVWNEPSKSWVRETSNNPAWVFLDGLTNPRYGAGLQDSRFNMEMIKEWAGHCERFNLTFDGVFDTTLTLWDAMQYILRCGHAQILTVGTIITVAIERAQPAVMMFSVANMIENTFQINWLPMAERANEVDVTYFDAVDGYKQHTLKVIDQDAVTNNVPIKTASVTIFGVIEPRRAYNEGLMQLAMNKHILQTVTFEAALDAIACSVGDVIYVQHDMPQWGFAGRTTPGSTASVINLDRPVSITVGNQYKLLCTFDAIQRASGSISNILGTSLYLTGYNGDTGVKRFLAAGKDLEVLSVFDAGGGVFGIVVYTVAGLTIGDTYTLQDTDVLEERDVVVNTSSDNFESINLASPFSQAPAEYTHFMFGKTTKIKKPFRVRAVSGSGEYSRQITAIEYNETIYNPDTTTILPTPNYSALDTGVKSVVISDVTETLYRIGSGFGVRASVHFESDQANYKTAVVMLSRNGGAFVEVGTDRSLCTVNTADGEVLVFKVVAMDVLGFKEPISNAAQITHTVIGKLAPPADVTRFNVTVTPNNLALTWDANTDIDFAYYEIRSGASWSDGSVLVTGLSSNRFIDDKSVAGTYSYYIRAVDTSGVYSNTPVMAEVVLTAPQSVTGFDCVSSGGRIEFRWSANLGSNINGYEIREGTSWNLSILIGQVSATSYTIPSGANGNRIFWIKAIAAPDIYSIDAVFTETQIAVSSNTNLIWSTDQSALSFPGYKNKATAVGTSLVMDTNTTRSEYIFPANLSFDYTAQNIVYGSIDSIAETGQTWANSAFDWDSPSSNRQWIINGSLMSVSARFQIAKYTGALDVSDYDGWSLAGTLTSINGITPSQSAAASYQSGRYDAQGLFVGDTTAVDWNVSIPAMFNITFWIIPHSVLDATYWGVTKLGAWLQLSYSISDLSFHLTDSAGISIVIPYAFVVNDNLCVGITQTATTRRLMIGRMGDKTSQIAELDVPPLGIFTKLCLY